MKTYAFDTKLWATFRVTAKSEKAARKMLTDFASDLTGWSADGIECQGASAEDVSNDELVEVDGECV